MIVEYLRRLLLKNDKRKSHSLSCHKCRSDTGTFDCSNFCNSAIFKMSGEFFTDMSHQYRINLMIDETVNF